MQSKFKMRTFDSIVTSQLKFKRRLTNISSAENKIEITRV